LKFLPVEVLAVFPFPWFEFPEFYKKLVLFCFEYVQSLMKCPDFPQLKQLVEELGRAGKRVLGALGWLVGAGVVVGRIKTGYLNGYEGGRGEERFWLKGQITNLVLFSGPWFDLSPAYPLDFPCPAFLASTASAVLTALL
jgi:hypothetical protein